MARLCAEYAKAYSAKRLIRWDYMGSTFVAPGCFSARYDRRVASIVKPCRTMKFAAILFIMAVAALGGVPGTLPTAGQPPVELWIRRSRTTSSL